MKTFFSREDFKRKRSNRQSYSSSSTTKSSKATEMAEVAALRAQIDLLTEHLQALKTDVKTVRENQDAFQTITTVEQYPEIRLTISDPKDINLKVFESLPRFDGNKSEYRSWRNRAWKLMEDIKNFQQSPPYYNALVILHTKIVGPAADILTNNNTRMNFYSIINRLDYTYADQRPLYVLQDEMKTITQGKRNLSEYHDAINQALNLILSKIDMANEAGRETLMSYANQDAVRTFIKGLNSSFSKGTLYSNNPRDLAQAYAIACTIYHDNEYQHLDTQPRYTEQQERRLQPQRPKFNPGIQVQRGGFIAHQHYEKPTPMEVDETRRFVRPTYDNNQQPRWNNGPRQNSPQHNPFRTNAPIQKRERNPSSQNYSQHKMQRINQTKQAELESVTAQYEDLYETGSTFLGE